MEVILDTNFIISCILNRIDFLEEIQNLGMKAVVPREVLEELKDIKKESKTSHEEREAIDIAFKMLEEAKVKKIKLGTPYVDEGLIKKGKEGVYIATLDRGIKREILNCITIDSAKKNLRIIRK